MTRSHSRMRPSLAPGFAPALLLLAGLASIAACGGRAATIESEAPVVALPIEADYFGMYDLYFGNAAAAADGQGEHAGLTATWSEADFVVSQDGNPMIRVDIAIDPASAGTGELRIWDEREDDPTCAAEGLYDYVDDGRTITLTVQSDPCVNRRASANGARLVRRQ